MAKHKRERHISTWDQIRALFAVFIGLGMASVSTFAYWTATSEEGEIQPRAATLDISLNTAPAGVQDGTLTVGTIGITRLIPGETYAFPMSVRNTGQLPVDLSISGYATGGLQRMPNPGTRWSFYSGGTPTNTGTSDAAGPIGKRTGVCTGGTLIGTANRQLSNAASTPTSIITSVPASSTDDLAVGASRSYCVVVTMAATQPTQADWTNLSYQTLTPFFLFRAVQKPDPVI